jgi:peptide/nickel transport system permease protein
VSGSSQYPVLGTGQSAAPASPVGSGFVSPYQMAAPPGLGTGRVSVLVRGLTRAGLVLVAGGLGLLVWPALILAGMPATYRGHAVPAGWSLVYNEPAQQLVAQRLGDSLGVLALALLLGAVIGFGTAGLRVVLAWAHADLGRAGGGVGWLTGMLWTPPVPLALTVLVLAIFFTSGGGAAWFWVLTLGLTGVVAVLVAVAAGERWRRGAWLAGGLAGVASAGRALAAATGALVVGEVLVGRPGLGSLLGNALLQEDRNVVAAATTVLLAIALAGQVVGALAGAFTDFLDAAPAPAVPDRSSLATAQMVAALATLVIPAMVVAGSLLARSPTTIDMTQSMASPSSAHLLGADPLGRDILARLLVGYRQTLLVALAGLALATVLGGAWGALAAAVARRLPGAGEPVAEVLLGPGRLVMVAPLLLAGIVLVGADRWPVAIALAVVLAPRLATAVTDLARPAPASTPAAIRTAIGMLLSACGVSLAVLAGLQLLGIGTRPPTPTLGGVLAEQLPYLAVNGQVAVTAVATLVTTAPFLLAGWALLRHPRQAEVLATLHT